jgi:hypothetical protein
MDANSEYGISNGFSLWDTSRALTLTGWLMLVDFVLCLAAMGFDSRQITGANAWLKPAKFGISSAITCLTIAWITGYISDWPKISKWASRVFAASIAIEIGVIDMQAARGTTSHFNVSSPFDKTAFMAMGVSICTLWISMAAMTYALMRQKLTPVSWQWALRLGLSLSLMGAAAGGFMLHETPGQRKIQDPPAFGAHTVGAPDGGPGLPFLNWSASHGDLRIPHFLGLHAMQAIPVVALWLSRCKGLSEPQRLRLVWLCAVAYALFFMLLTWQALRGQALLRPDGATMLAAAAISLVIGAGSARILSPQLQASLNGWARVLEVRS